jgi:hypothetical protein
MSKTRGVIKNKHNKTKKCKINYIPQADKDIKAIIDVNAIRHNIKFLKNKTGTDIMPVLKADAYGHGLIEMARILRKLNIILYPYIILNYNLGSKRFIKNTG